MKVVPFENVLEDVLLIMGGYVFIALVVYIILYRKACENYMIRSYNNLETYIEIVGALWPFFMAVAIVVLPIIFIKNKFKH